MKNRPKTGDTLAKNLKALMQHFRVSKKALSVKSGVSERMIGYILAQERSASIEVADQLAQAFGLTGWQLLIPSLMIELAKNGRLEALVSNYMGASSEGQAYIDSVAHREATTGQQLLITHDPKEK